VVFVLVRGDFSNGGESGRGEMSPLETLVVSCGTDGSKLASTGKDLAANSDDIKRLRQIDGRRKTAAWSRIRQRVMFGEVGAYPEADSL
jgi:hypothetical protein